MLNFLLIRQLMEPKFKNENICQPNDPKVDTTTGEATKAETTTAAPELKNTTSS